jgi:hypothetical protein
MISFLLSAGVSRLMAALLFGLNLLDAVSFFGVSVLLAGVAVLAMVVPARRAVRLHARSRIRP